MEKPELKPDEWLVIRLDNAQVCHGEIPGGQQLVGILMYLSTGEVVQACMLPRQATKLAGQLERMARKCREAT